MLPIDFWYHPNSPTTVVINCSALQKRKLRCRQVRHLLEASPLVGMQLGCGELLGKVDRQVVGRWVPKVKKASGTARTALQHLFVC